MPSAADIAAKLQAKGQAMTLGHTSAGTFDPVTGSTTGSTTTTTTVYGITSNYGSIARLASQASPNSLILTGDKKALISALVAPAVGDTLTIMGVVWVIMAVDALEPQGETLLYTCQIRRG